MAVKEMLKIAAMMNKAM